MDRRRAAPEPLVVLRQNHRRAAQDAENAESRHSNPHEINMLASALSASSASLRCFWGIPLTTAAESL